MLRYTNNDQTNRARHQADAQKYTRMFRVSMSAVTNPPPCIMIVDDENILLEMVAALIEDLGMRTLVATNGREALNALKNMQPMPALILSDVMMPQMGGIELANAVKRDPHLCRVPVILMSAAGEPASADAIVADGFIHKPFDLDLLVDLIDRYVPGDEQEYGF